MLPTQIRGDLNRALKVFKGFESSRDDPTIVLQIQNINESCFLRLKREGWKITEFTDFYTAEKVIGDIRIRAFYHPGH